MESALMKLPNVLTGCRDVVIDTNVFIYLFDDHPDFADVAEFIINQAEANAFSAIITPITLSEIVVKPYSLQRPDLADSCISALHSYRNIRIKNIDGKTAQMAGALRAQYKKNLPDMFQAAMALHASVPILLTNDKALRVVKEIQVLTLQDFLH
jgi:predicted nucleic acid-binding protein